ncbi:MAG: sensor histidine kinase [Ornithinibacter sp.]|nr:sensor histidine kinase [Ornithinibacter sp.]
MRRVLLGTALQTVLTTLLLVLAVLAVLLAWPRTPGGSVLPQSMAPDAALPPAALVAVLVAVLLAGVLALGISTWLAGRRADRVAWFIDTLGERAERLGPGDPRPVPLNSGIEEVDRLDAALARGAEQGARRLASERDFAADASHQLRAIGQVERLSGVVDDLMSRTRSGAETSPTVSLDSVLASLQREWQPAFAGARRSIHVRGERGLGVRATPVALAQILTTLLENSLTHGRGTVEISARRAGPSVVIEVADGGEGVPAAIAPHVFERSVSSSGTGLGLSLARDLAEAAGGRLELVRARPPLFALFLSASEL